MSTLIWFIIIIGLILALPNIIRWLSALTRQWIARAVERRIRRMMGIPPEQDTRGNTRRADRGNKKTESGKRHSAARSARHEPLIPKEYAVDVEYTEIREYSARTEIHPEPDGVRVVTESQVTDAEYVVIRPDDNPSRNESADNPKESKKRFWK